ncbi:DUF3347 domain-containing protein [Lentisphaera profundi]|uniref:DUF3347 domain-containing protein n=1 Tax=Lentisphaera profundi TaxID=1658616 RepID=A0ABY7VTB5_9BACT|nr:DUF3347 domain-containing protein [Lentisphaera profundi]WDE97443.1 DUF3347 domain-containing protein [Lentisphaera profundi]
MSQAPEDDLIIFNTPQEFQKDLENFHKAYLDISTDLSKDKFDRLKLQREAMEAALATIDPSLLAVGARDPWIKSSRLIELKMKHLSNSASLDQARVRFKVLSLLMIKAIEQFGSHLPIKHAYCPMAFDNAGAPWLQLGEAVANPYFGSGMYSCGEIKKSYGPVSSPTQKAPELDHSKHMNHKKNESTVIDHSQHEKHQSVNLSDNAELLLQDYLKMQQAFSHDKKPDGPLVESLSNSLQKLSENHKLITAELIKSIAHMHHKDIESARSDFEKISLVMITMAEAGTFKSPLNQAYCPMAFENKGASWLQLANKIENPYFGSMMFRCGSVKKSFKGSEK